MKQRKASPPPGLAEGLLRWCLPRSPAGKAGSILGDLRQEHAALQRRTSALQARIWYWRQALRIGLGYLLFSPASTPPPSLQELPAAGEKAGVGAMNTTLYDLRSALRSLARSPGFTLLAILTLALGLGANTAVFTVVESVLLRPLPYRDPDRMVFIFNQFPDLGVLKGAQTPGDYADYLEQATLFEEFASASLFPQTLLGQGNPLRVNQAIATTNIFQVLGVQPHLGRLFDSDDQGTINGPTAVILSHEFWQSHFGGDPDLIGAQLRFNTQSKTVVGILPPGFRLLAPPSVSLPGSIQAWTPLPKEWMGPDGKDRSAHWMKVYARLKPGVSLLEAQAEMDALAARQRQALPRREERKARISVVPLRSAITADVASTLLLLQGAVAFVLLIVCANVANLFLVRSQGRTREIAIRLALGGGRLRILRQLMLEGLALALGGAALGVLLARWSIPLLMELKPVELPVLGDVGVNLNIAAFVSAAALLTALVFALAPSWTASRVAQSEALSSARGQPGGRRGWPWRLLVVAEVSLTLVLLTGAALLLSSFVGLTRVDPGFHHRDVLTFSIPLPQDYWQGGASKKTDFMQRLEQRLEGLPGVDRVSHAWPLPLGSDPRVAEIKTEQEVRDNQAGQLVSYRLIRPGYLSKFRIPLLQGRAFEDRDRKDKIVVDRSLAEHLWPGRSPLGRKIRVSWWSGPVLCEVIGVVENLRSIEPRQDDPHSIYLRAEDWMHTSLFTMVQSSVDPLTLVQSVRTIVADMDERAPVEGVSTLEAQLSDRMASNRFAAALIGVFAGAALLLALIGLYAVLTNLVRMRVSEFGVRMAFGADALRILSLVLRQGLTMATLGLLIGTAVALALTRFLQSLLYGVSATEPAVLAGAALLLAAVSILACWLPARRASRMDPVETLRAD